MRILRVRFGFQADHSSSSYLFYSVDGPVSAEGQAIAHRFSSRAEVDKRHVRYVKWGESSLASTAYEALMNEHYDVMAEESYGWWTMMIAVPKNPEMKAVLAPFTNARGANDQGIELQEFSKRLVVTIYCQFAEEGVNLSDDYRDSPLDTLVNLLAKVRNELIAGNTSFLRAVAEFYDALDDDDDEVASDDSDESSATSVDDMSKAELQEECDQRGITYRKSWRKAQLVEALGGSGMPRSRGRSKNGSTPKLSHVAKTIVDQLESQ